jgi:hypothetical protein
MLLIGGGNVLVMTGVELSDFLQAEKRNPTIIIVIKSCIDFIEVFIMIRY